MYKPSRFLNSQALPANIYQSNYIHKIQVQARYLLSKPLFRLHEFNFHLGIDLYDQTQIFAITSEVILKLIQIGTGHTQRGRLKKAFTFLSERVWEGVISLCKKKYSMSVYKKNGCLLIEYLNQLGKTSSKNLFFLFLLMIQLLAKIHTAKLNLKFIDIRSLQLVQSPSTKQVCLQICLPQSTELQGQKTKSIKEEQKIRPIYREVFRTPPKKSKVLIPKVESLSKNPHRRDIQLLFQKFVQVEKQFKQNQQQCDIQNLVQSLITLLNKDQDCKIGLDERILGYTTQLFDDMKLNRADQEKEMIEILNKIRTKNHGNLVKFQKQLENDLAREMNVVGCDSLKEIFDECTVGQQQQIFYKVQKHTLNIDKKSPSILSCK